MDYSYVRGFNYQPQYAYNLCEVWRFFDEKVFIKELGNGKKIFPNFNTVRIWLSFDAYIYQPLKQQQNFEKVLQICDSYKLKVIPVLFNRWHDYVADAGGIYFDHFIKGSSLNSVDDKAMSEYILNIVGNHAKDDRILLWDMCNEPFSYGVNCTKELRDFLTPYEEQWLKNIYDKCKKTGVIQPVSFSPYPVGVDFYKKHEDISDVFLIHPYYHEDSLDDFVKKISDVKNYAESKGKGVLTTEACWGSLKDEERVEIVKKTLEAHKISNIGYCLHALCYSHVADLHNPEDGVVGAPGNLAFINKDGSLRKGHDIFNKY